MMRSQPLSHPSTDFLNDQEATFCRAWVDPVDRERLTNFYLLVVINHVLVLFCHHFISSLDHIIHIAYGVQIITFPLLAWGALHRKNLHRFKSCFNLSMLITFMAINGEMIYRALSGEPRPDLLVSISIHMMIGLLYPHALRQPWFPKTLVIGGHIIGLWIALSDAPAHFIVCAFLTASYCSSLILAFSNQKNEWLMAQAEFRFRSYIVPGHLLTQTSSTRLEITDVFQPKKRFCVCLSSDWRNLDHTSKYLASSQIADTLSEYYQMCQNLSQKIFTSGNFYTDWIGNELFFSAYTDSKDEERVVIRQMIQFALSLSEAKVDFSRIRGLPSSIDIAIAAGTGLVGVMGPRHHLKSTTLGDVPGRARLLQNLGFAVRERHGHRDRLLISREVLMLLSEPLPITPFRIETERSIHGLQDQEIFFCDIPLASGGEDFKTA